jgi:hypothetical protein
MSLYALTSGCDNDSSADIGSSPVNPAVLSLPQPLEPPLLCGHTRYDSVLLNWRTSLAQENWTRKAYSNRSAERLWKLGIQLPAIRSTLLLAPLCDHGTSKMGAEFLYTSNAGSASCAAQAQEHPPFLTGFQDGTRAKSAPIIEPKFAALLTAGSDMKTVLEAMDQELSPQDVFDFLRVDLARPPMPKEPVVDPDYKPRPSTLTGQAPKNARHSEKETERRAQHKHYLDLSELKIPDFFLKLCGWDEARDSGSKRTPRTKSSILQAGCLYMWFVSGPVIHCYKSLLQNNHRLEEEVKRLEKESHGLLLRCESVQFEDPTKAEHRNAASGQSSLKSGRVPPSGSHRSPLSTAPSLDGFTILEEPEFSRNDDTHLFLLSEYSRRVQSKSSKRRSPSVPSQGESSPASPPKKRKANRDVIVKQDVAAKMSFEDDIENSVPDIAFMRDQNKYDLTPSQMDRMSLSSAPSLQSATSSCWDSASVVSTSSSWGQPSPHSIADS